MKKRTKDGTIVDLTPDEIAERAAQQQAQVDAATARQAQRDARLADIPATVMSVPALRDAVNEILKELRNE